MIPSALDALIKRGEASFGTFASSGALTILRLPVKSSAIIITKIKLKAFADLPAGDFTDLQAVVDGTWHQLRVCGYRGINIFQARHELREFNDTTAGVVFLPQGETEWDVFIPHDTEDIIFDLCNVGRFIQGSSVPAAEKLPQRQKTPYPQPPNGYGKGTSGIAVSAQVIYAAKDWGYRSFGQVGEVDAGIKGKSRTAFSVPYNTDTKLAPPQPGINFGTLTMPVLEVEYFYINKATDITLPSAVVG